MTTYSTDADIVARHPGVSKLRWNNEAGYERVRQLVYEQINLALSRRHPHVSFPESLADRTQLKNCEVYGVLAELFGSNQASGVNDFFLMEQTRFARMYQTELAQPVSLVGGGTTYRSIRVARG